MYDVGDTAVLTADCLNAAGALANATTVALTVTRPDGTPDTPTVTNPPAITGRYTHSWLTAQLGLHRYRYVFTGAVPDQAHGDVFHVYSPETVALVGMAELKAHLNIEPADTLYDDELRGFILTGSIVVEDLVGAVARRTVTETHTSYGDRVIQLRNRPVISVTSVTEDGQLVASTDYSLSPTSGLLYKTTNYRAGCWRPGVNNITVTYVPGRSKVDANIVEGLKELIRINWRSQHGTRTTVDDFGNTVLGEIRLGYFVPNAVLERLAPHRRGPNIA